MSGWGNYGPEADDGHGSKTIHGEFGTDSELACRV